MQVKMQFSPWPEEAVDDPKAGVELGCWPNTGGALGFTPKAGAADAGAVKEDAVDPKAGTVDCEVPNAGVCAEPKPEAAVVVVNPNGDGVAEGAGAEREEGPSTLLLIQNGSKWNHVVSNRNYTVCQNKETVKIAETQN